MGFRFRKSIRIAKGVRLNVGTKSVGISAGVKGARISTNSRTGTRVTTSLPGTGLSYSTKIGGDTQSRGRSSNRASAPAALAPTTPMQSLEAGEVHHVQLNGNTMLWPWLCACCGTKYSGEVPVGAQEVAPGVHALKTAISTFEPSYCQDCTRHQSLWAQLHALPQPISQSGTVGGAGLLLFGLIGPGMTLVLLAFSMPFWAAFLICFLICVAAQVNVVNNAKVKEEELRVEHARSVRDLNERIEKAKTPRCTCCGLAVRLESSHGSMRRFAFRNQSLSRTFATMNSKKVIY